MPKNDDKIKKEWEWVDEQLKEMLKKYKEKFGKNHTKSNLHYLIFNSIDWS